MPHANIKLLVQNFGLFSLCNISYEVGDKGLISAFVERWHRETNFFHLPVGEMTITLDDVSSLLHLPILGQFPTFVPLEYNEAATILAELLGVDETRGKAEMRQCRGVHVRLSWLRDIYEEFALRRLGSVLPWLTCCICLDALFSQKKVPPLYLYCTYCYSAIYICVMDMHGEQQYLHIYMSSWEMHLILTRSSWPVMRHWFRYETIQIISNHMLYSIMFCIKYFIINMIELRRHGFMSTSRAWEEEILISHKTRYTDGQHDILLPIRFAQLVMCRCSWMG